MYIPSGGTRSPVRPPWWLRWTVSWRTAWQPTQVFLPGESSWTEKSGGLQSMGSQRVGHAWVTEHTAQGFCDSCLHPSELLELALWDSEKTKETKGFSPPPQPPQTKHRGPGGTSVHGRTPWLWRQDCVMVWGGMAPSSPLFHFVQFSRSVVSDSLQPQGLQHTRLPCPSPTPRACSNSGPTSWWCHPAISSSVVPCSSCPQSFPASGSFPVSQLFPSGGQSIGVSASASVLPMNIQGWLLISLQSKGLSSVFSNTTVQKHQFFGTQLSLSSNSHIHTWLLEKP